MMIKVYGASDDLVEIEGAGEHLQYTDEIGCFDYDVRMTFSDGTVILIHYGISGIWKITVEKSGYTPMNLHVCSDPDETPHSDVLTINAEVSCWDLVEKMIDKRPPARPLPIMVIELNQFQQLAQRTTNCRTTSAKIENGVLGLCGESGECSDILKKYLYQGHELDKDHLIEELGDVLWYCAELASGLGVDLSAVATTNIQKLMKRYPNGFDTDRSQNRSDEHV